MIVKNKFLGRVPKLWIALLVFLSAVISFNGCGNKGSLYMAPVLLPGVIENLQVHQIGNQIHLEWTFPKFLSDGKTSFDPRKIKNLYIYYANEEYPAIKFRKKSKLLHKLKYLQIDFKQTRSSFAMKFSNRDLVQKSHYFALYYKYERKSSPLSTIVSLDSALPPQIIRDLQVSHEGKVIKLKWSRPTQDITDNKVGKILGYKVFRKVEETEQSNPPAKFSPINAARVLREYFEDKDTGTDGTYVYQISTIIAKKIDSFPSNRVKVAVTDIYPPEIPANLVSFKAKDHIYLSWAKARDLDFSHYQIYRKINHKEDFQLIIKSIKTNFYTDRSVKPGTTYYYYVTSMDQKKNESNRSNVARTEY